MSQGNPEQATSNPESIHFSKIVDDMAAIANKVAAEPENTFQLVMKSAEVPGIGVIHWQQILEEIHVRVTQREAKDAVHGNEVDCLYILGDDGPQLAKSSDAFAITTPRVNGGLHGHYRITHVGDGFVQAPDNDGSMKLEDIEATAAFVSKIVEQTPDDIAA